MDTNKAIVVIMVSLLASGFFSGAETAIVACSKVRLRSRAKGGSWRARLLQRLLERPETLFGTVLVGNNLAVISCTAVSTGLAVALWGDSGAFVATAVMAPLLLIAGEVIPKSAFLYHADTVAVNVAPLIRMIEFVLLPIVVPATLLSRALMRLTGAKKERYDMLSTREELVYLYGSGRRGGETVERERRIIDSVFEFGARRVGDLMVPMSRAVTFPVAASVDEVVDEAARHTYSRFPLVDPADGSVVGVVSLFDLLGRDGGERLAAVMHTPLFVRAEEKAERLLIRMKRDSLHFAVVLGPGGEVAGIITLEDILESFVGKISNEYE